MKPLVAAQAQLHGDHVAVLEALMAIRAVLKKFPDGSPTHFILKAADGSVEPKVHPDIETLQRNSARIVIPTEALARSGVLKALWDAAETQRVAAHTTIDNLSAELGQIFEGMCMDYFKSCDEVFNKLDNEQGWVKLQKARGYSKFTELAASVLEGFTLEQVDGLRNGLAKVTSLIGGPKPQS